MPATRANTTTYLADVGGVAKQPGTSGNDARLGQRQVWIIAVQSFVIAVALTFAWIVFFDAALLRPLLSPMQPPANATHISQAH